MNSDVEVGRTRLTFELSSVSGLATSNLSQPVQQPRFMDPTFISSCSTAPTNYVELDRVRNSFSSGACWGIRKLPANLKPGSINDMRKRETATNLSSVPLAAIRPMLAPQLAHEQGIEPRTLRGLKSLTKSVFGDPTSSLAKRPGMKGTGTGAGIDRIIFGKTPVYMGTVFGREHEVKRNQESEQKMLAESFSRPAFSIDASGYKHLAIGFVPPDFGPGFKPEWDSLKRKDEEHTFLNGPFSKCVPTHGMLPLKSNTKRWCRLLYELLAEDWPNLHFTLRITKDELLVQFPTLTQVLPAMGAVQKYMAHLIAHGEAMKIGLKKRGDRWGVLELQHSDLPVAPSSDKVTSDSCNRPDTPESNDDYFSEDALALVQNNVGGRIGPGPGAGAGAGAGPGSSQEQYLTFSLYFPWVVVGRLVVHKDFAKKERKLIVATRNANRKKKSSGNKEEQYLDQMLEEKIREEKEAMEKQAREKGKRFGSILETKNIEMLLGT